MTRQRELSDPAPARQGLIDPALLDRLRKTVGSVTRPWWQGEVVSENGLIYGVNIGGSRPPSGLVPPGVCRICRFRRRSGAGSAPLRHAIGASGRRDQRREPPAYGAPVRGGTPFSGAGRPPVHRRQMPRGPAGAKDRTAADDLRARGLLADRPEPVSFRAISRTRRLHP